MIRHGVLHDEIGLPELRVDNKFACLCGQGFDSLGLLGEHIVRDREGKQPVVDHSSGTWSFRGTDGEVLHVTQTPHGFLVETETEVVVLLPHGAAAALSAWIDTRMGGGAEWTGKKEKGVADE